AGSRITAPYARLFGPMSVAGTYQVARTEFAGTGQAVQAGLPYDTIYVSDSVHLTGTTAAASAVIVIHGGHLLINGQKLITDSLDVGGDASQGLREAYLSMDNAADSVVVTGNAVFDSDTSGLMSDGVLLVTGTLRVQRGRSFRASGSHRTVLNGTAAQSLRARNGTRFQTLEIVNPVGPVSIAPARPIDEDVDVTVLGKFAVRTSIAVTGGEARIDVGDSLVTVAGSTVNIYAFIARDRIRVDGEMAATEFEFAGASQDIPASISYGHVVVSGSARLVGRTTFPGYTNVYGAGASLTLKGQRLDAATFSVGGSGINTGTVVMSNAADSLVVAGDVAFAGAPSAGTLTAGTIVAGGGFHSGDSPTSFQPSGTHRVVLNGSGQQVVSLPVPGAAEQHFNDLELANTSGGIWLWHDVPVLGALSVSTTAPSQTLSGTSHHRITAAGVAISRLPMDTVSLAIGAGSIARFDTVTFTRQDR